MILSDKLKANNRYYLAPGEDPPHRTSKSKRFITSAMFVQVAVARPRFDTVRNCITFDGRIGIFPFVCKKAAQGSSRNRAAGTLETKCIASVTKDVCNSCREDIAGYLRERWPRGRVGKSSDAIIIQQDNDKPHVKIDPTLADELCKDGSDIQIECPLPNCPDLNVLI